MKVSMQSNSEKKNILELKIKFNQTYLKTKKEECDAMMVIFILDWFESNAVFLSLSSEVYLNEPH